MSTVVDTLITRYIMDPQAYLQAAKAVSSATANLAKQMDGLATMGGMKVGHLSDGMSKLKSAALPVVGVFAALGAEAIRSFNKYAEFDALEKALTSIEGSATKAHDAVRRLKEIAKMPGLGVEEAIQGFAGLRNAGLNQALSEEVIRQFGNANARSGGGKEELGRILIAIQQMAVKPFLQGDELMQLMEARIPAPAILKQRFGTADTQLLQKQGITSLMVIQGLTAELAKLPRVGDSAKNSIENFKDALDAAEVSLGGAVASFAVKPLNQLSDAVTELANAGVVSDAVKEFAGALGIAKDNSISVKDGLVKMIAAFQTLGDQIEVFKGNMEGFIGLMRTIAGVATSPLLRPLTNPTVTLLKALGIDVEAFSKGGDLMETTKNFKAHEEEITMKLKASERAAARSKIAPPDGSVNQASAPTPAPSTWEDYLKQIAQNTRDTADKLQEQVLGGGVIGRRGLNAADVSGIHGGRYGRLGRATEDFLQAIQNEVWGIQMADAGYSRVR